MLNVKRYIFLPKVGSEVQTNSEANETLGLCNIKVVELTKKLETLDSLKTKEEVVLDLGSTERKRIKRLGDSMATIKLTEYKVNHLTYQSISAKMSLLIL